MPLLFRMLYGCGLRISEALRTKILESFFGKLGFPTAVGEKGLDYTTSAIPLPSIACDVGYWKEKI
jgi:integrase